jgi:hypothetical protein
MQPFYKVFRIWNKQKEEYYTHSGNVFGLYKTESECYATIKDLEATLTPYSTTRKIFNTISHFEVHKFKLTREKN